MAIKKDFTGGGNKMMAGEHRVSVAELKMGVNSKQKPMLTITFKNDQDQTIKGYYTLGVVFIQKQLEALKVACGLDKNADGNLLLGKRCGISVEEGDVDEKGRMFMRIVGYGKESEVSEADTFNNPTTTSAATSQPVDSIPF